MNIDIYGPNSPTPHNAALPGQVAPLVLMSGDPLRAKTMAGRFLDDAVLVSEVRGMLCYTGSYRGKPISFMGSGMGGPSMGIYSYELFAHYGVERIIRVGTCGGLTEAVEVGDLVIAMTSCTDSAYASQYGLPGSFSPCADFSLLQAAALAAKRVGLRYFAGNILSSDVFSLYSARGDAGWKAWARMGCVATDMECFALYCNAAYLGKKALTLLTCSDSNVSGKAMNSDDRQNSLVAMYSIALELL